MQEQTPKDVFISYRHCNAELVKPIEEELKRRGISYFIDRIGVDIGMDYSERISQSIKKCKILLVIWTKDADDSTHMLREVTIAFDHKKKVIPYKVGSFDVKEHDSLYYQLSHIDRQEADPQQTQETINKLVNSIEKQIKENVTQPTTEPLKEQHQPQSKEINDLSISGASAGERTTIIINGEEFAFRWCPAGTFKMGSPESEVGRGSDETLHKVTLTKGFWMMESEVTQKQWKAVMGSNPSHNIGDDLPVEMVTWFECQEFCRRTNLQLPTEAQWEYACRAGSAGPYAGKLEDLSWYQSNSDDTTHPVRQKKPNKWGLYDMHGQLWEWCEDWYDSYPRGCVTDPTGPSSGSAKVRRGGGKGAKAETCRSAQRRSEPPQKRETFIGFRCVKVQ